MFDAIWTAVRKSFEYVGLISKPPWELTDEEEELARRYDDMFKVETLAYQERKGHVTQMQGNAIELDHRWIYQLVHDNEVFSIGDYVSWKMYKTAGDAVIKDVIRVDEEGKFELTSLSAQIVKVTGTKYETNVGAIFYGDRVRSDLNFIPQLSDMVTLECSHPKNETGTAEEFSPDPNSLVVKRVSPCDSKLVTGQITSWDSSTSTGLVNKVVVFHQNVCDELTPTIGVSVVCNCVRGEYDGGYKWRAYNMAKNVRAGPSIKNHFFVVEPIPQFEVVLGESKTVELRVSNSSSAPFLIENVEFCYYDNQKTEPPSTLKLPYNIFPDTSVSWPVVVKGEKLGRQELKIHWKLTKNKFPIRTTIKYITVQQNLGVQTDSRNDERRRNNRSMIIPGQRKMRHPVFRRVPIKEYVVPEELRELCQNETGMDLTNLQIALQRERPVMSEGLCEKNYGEFMHTLLYLEEIEEEKILARLSTRASLYRTRECVVFNFPADSGYSRIVCGDSVLASKPWETLRYEGKVWSVSSVQLGLKFNADFEYSMTSGALYDLEFRLNRSSNRRCHQAVDLVLRNLGPEWLFPNEHNPVNTHTQKIDKWFNTDLNKEQKNAVENILAKKNLPHPYIIYGPPGTGKTVTVVETILQIVVHQPDARLLVTAPTNSAVDTLGIRLLEFGVFDKSELVRLSSYKAYSSGVIAVQLLDIAMVPSLGDPAHDTPLARDGESTPTMFLDDMCKHKITIGTLATISHLNCSGVSKGFFTHVIIDEAGQCHEPESLLPIALLEPNKTQLVLAGDPQQLGPVTHSMLAGMYSYDRSFLDRLTKSYLYRKKIDAFQDTHGFNPVLITRLVMNYRSLPKIVDVIGSIFYGRDLYAIVSDKYGREADVLRSITIHREVLSQSMESMLFINVDTPEEQVEGSLSWYNQGEIAQVFFVLNFLHSAKVSVDDIGVITPYSLQAKKIYEYLDNVGAISPKVASVEEFQGQERDVIILSLVRNSFGFHKKLSSFLTDPHRVNVALSRARVLNIIIGNRSTLVVDPLWAEIICKCRVINLTPAPRVEDTVD